MQIRKQVEKEVEVNEMAFAIHLSTLLWLISAGIFYKLTSLSFSDWMLYGFIGIFLTSGLWYWTTRKVTYYINDDSKARNKRVNR